LHPPQLADDVMKFAQWNMPPSATGGQHVESRVPAHPSMTKPQVHAPKTHSVPSPSAHRRPHRPQLSGSLLTAAHVGTPPTLQQRSAGAQVGSHVPAASRPASVGATAPSRPASIDAASGADASSAPQPAALAAQTALVALAATSIAIQLGHARILAS